MQATIVVPCYNEAKRLKCGVFLDFLRLHDDNQLLFVNDGSTDGTLDVLRDLEKSCPNRIHVVELEQNSGKAEAVRQGMLAAMDGGASYAAYWDADLATPLDEVADFREILDRTPATVLVMGSRVCLLGRSIRRRPARHLLGRGFASAASLILRLKVYDTQCGAKMFRVSPEIKRLFEEPFSSRWIFDVELIARMISMSHSGALESAEDIIYEQPLRHWEDVQGSKLKPFDFVRAFQELVVIHRKHRIRSNQKRAILPPATKHATRPEPNPLPDDQQGRKAA